MADRIPHDHPLCRLFETAVDRAFQEYPEIYDPEVSAHISGEVLPDFVHTDRLYRLRNARGRRLHELPEMVDVARAKEGPERRLEVDRYIGDFVLFMVGFFPNSVRRGRWLAPDPLVSRVGKVFVSFSHPLDYYVAEGRNAYSRAAATARLFVPQVHHTYARLSEELDRYLEVVALVKKLLHDNPDFRKLEDVMD